VNGPGQGAARLRARVRAALAEDDLEPVVADLLELRFPAHGNGASLDEAGAARGMSPSLVAHIEFGALCALSARRTCPGGVATTGSDQAGWASRQIEGRGRS
jgi:hypothetical protein